MKKKIDPSKDLVNQPPPLSYPSLRAFLEEHDGEVKVRVSEEIAADSAAISNVARRSC